MLLISRVRFVALLLLCVVLGCGSPHDSTVSGKVTLDGQPLTTGTVTFAPQGEGRIAYGEINASGEYAVRTLGDQGMLPGKYNVTIRATGQAAESHLPPPLLTPEKYGDPATSGFTAEIKPGANSYNFDMSSK